MVVPGHSGLSCAGWVNLSPRPGIHIFLEGSRVMKGKESLRVSVLGNLAVQRHCTRMQLPPSKKTRALLGYLAVTARPHSRDRLCAMFWAVPDDPRAALRGSLSRLRPLVDEAHCRRIIPAREHVGW